MASIFSIIKRKCSRITKSKSTRLQTKETKLKTLIYNIDRLTKFKKGFHQGANIKTFNKDKVKYMLAMSNEENNPLSCLYGLIIALIIGATIRLILGLF